jgi:hypothetical protein
MDAIHSAETLQTTYGTTWGLNTDDHTTHLHLSDKFKSHMMMKNKALLLRPLVYAGRPEIKHMPISTFKL